MNPQVCKNLLATLIRHQFYTKVAWEWCDELPKPQIEKEFRAVIQVLINEDAPELSDAERHELEESLISDARSFGSAAMAQYSMKLNPPQSIGQKFVSWLAAPLNSFLNQRQRKFMLQRIRAGQA